MSVVPKLTLPGWSKVKRESSKIMEPYLGEDQIENGQGRDAHNQTF